MKKHLSSHLGKGFCPTQQSISMLLEGHGTFHYGCKQCTYDEKEKSKTVQWTEKNIDNEIVIYLQRHLSSKSIDPSSVCRVQKIVGCNHGDTAFQFGTLVLIELDNEHHLDFEVMVCELICCKDS